MAVRMMIVQIGESGNVVFTELTAKGIANLDNPAHIAVDGQWNPWSEWMSKDRALEQITDFINDD